MSNLATWCEILRVGTFAKRCSSFIHPLDRHSLRDPTWDLLKLHMQPLIAMKAVSSFVGFVDPSINLKIHCPVKLFYLNYTLRSETPFSRKIEGDPANSIAEQMIRLNKPTKHARTLHRQIRSPNYLPQTLTTFVPPKLSVALSCYFPELFSTLSRTQILFALLLR